MDETGSIFSEISSIFGYTLIGKFIIDENPMDKMGRFSNKAI
jgi:hypothetical protein